MITHLAYYDVDSPNAVDAYCGDNGDVSDTATHTSFLEVCSCLKCLRKATERPYDLTLPEESLRVAKRRYDALSYHVAIEKEAQVKRMRKVKAIITEEIAQ